MAKKPRLKMILYTLCLEGTPTSICALESKALEKDMEGSIRGALFETWRFAGGDVEQLVDRKVLARPPTKRESSMWWAAAEVNPGKPYLVLAGGGEEMGTA